MSTVPEIEKAVRQLSPEELAEFRQWFADFVAEPGIAKSNETLRPGDLTTSRKKAVGTFAPDTIA